MNRMCELVGSSIKCDNNFLEMHLEGVNTDFLCTMRLQSPVVQPPEEVEIHVGHNVQA
jgi:hypothetical protein